MTEKSKKSELVEVKDITFAPTPEQIMFKNYLHERLPPEDIIAFLSTPEGFADKIFPFSIEAIQSWLSSRNFCIWLVIFDFTDLYIESKRLEYIQKVEEIAFSDYVEDAKTAGIKLQALKTLLDIGNKKQPKQPKESTLLLKEAPKSLAKLSNFELKTQVKQLEEVTS